ncbi:MAG: glycosyltransferase family 39 protein [Neisseria sp.]|nr:glycosyltransferase family 39 protein [Neisseria sp.]
MLTYIPPHLQKPTRPDERPWVLLFLVFVWLWPGIINHDPWRPNEPLLYAALQSVARGESLLAPTVFDELFVRHAPVFLWLGSIFKNLFSPQWMDGYTAARLVTTLFMALALACAGGAGRELLGKYHGRSVVLILIGCPGIMIFGHMMGSTPILFAAMCAFIYGIALARRKVMAGGLLMGLGWLFAFASGNFPPLIFLLLMAVLLPFSPAWRTRRYLLAGIIALALTLPLLPLWPYALWQSHPAAFQVWWQQYAFGEFGGAGSLQWDFSLAYVLKNLIWYALPAWLLAAWSIYKRDILRKPAGFLCTLWLALAMLMITLQGNADNDRLLWLLPPLALLGAAGLDTLRRGATAFLNWFGIMTFGMMALGIWIMFFAVNYGFPHALATLSARFNPHFTPHWNYFPMLLALAFTPLWLWAITRKNIRGRQAVTNWAAGMTLVWTLMLSLFLPWLDSLKSYRPLVMRMQTVLPEELKSAFADGSECIDSTRINALTAWNEYGSIRVYPPYAAKPQTHCNYRITTIESAHETIPRGWQILWSGSRGGSSKELFVLMKNTNEKNE